jgi:hypothetical protein
MTFYTARCCVLALRAPAVCPPPPPHTAHPPPQAVPGAPLVIFELGGGNGTNARAILDHIRATAPRVYARTTYTIVEVSGAMAARQRAAAVAGGHANCAVVHADAVTWDGWGTVTAAAAARVRGASRAGGGGGGGSGAAAAAAAAAASPPFVLALEVLDNLPHDKIAWREGAWWQVEVERNADGALTESVAYVPPA